MTQNNYTKNTTEFKGLIIWDHDGTLVNTDAHTFTLFKGVKEILLDLKGLGFEMAIWTARPRASTLESLKNLEIVDFFGEIYCYDDGPSKPHPEGLQKLVKGRDKKHVLHIGDSRSDIAGAHSFGVDVIAACWYSARNVNEFKKMTSLIAMQVSDCQKIIAEKFNVKWP